MCDLGQISLDRLLPGNLFVKLGKKQDLTENQGWNPSRIEINRHFSPQISEFSSLGRWITQKIYHCICSTIKFIYEICKLNHCLQSQASQHILYSFCYIIKQRKLPQMSQILQNQQRLEIVIKKKSDKYKSKCNFEAKPSTQKSYPKNLQPHM